MINTGQAAKAAAGSILPGGPRLCWGHMGEGPQQQPGSGALGAGRGVEAGKAGIAQAVIHPFFTCPLIRWCTDIWGAAVLPQALALTLGHREEKTQLL